MPLDHMHQVVLRFLQKVLKILIGCALLVDHDGFDGTYGHGSTSLIINTSVLSQEAASFKIADLAKFFAGASNGMGDAELPLPQS
jgi:hypothetical protein